MLLLLFSRWGLSLFWNSIRVWDREALFWAEPIDDNESVLSVNESKISHDFSKNLIFLCCNLLAAHLAMEVLWVELCLSHEYGLPTSELAPPYVLLAAAVSSEYVA